MASQFIKFCIVGVFNTLVNYTVFFLVLRLGVDYRIAGVGGFLSGAIPGFFLNRRFTFESRVRVGRGLLAYLCAQGLSLAAHTVTQWASVVLVGIPEELSQLIGIAASMTTNFLLLKFVVFGETAHGASAGPNVEGARQVAELP